jgi:prefoldin subunit 5
MQNIQDVFKRINDTKQKIKTIRRTYKDALESTSHYRDLLEKLESLKATKKEIEVKTKSELGAEY